MPIFLRQSTASQEIPLGYFVDSTDGNTEETGLTIANTDIKLHKAGATTLANKNSGGGTHISNGVYYAVLDATDTNTLGSLVIFCHPSGALPVRVECVVLSSQVYDSLIAASDALQVDTIQVGGTTQTARDLGASVLLSSGTGTGQISLSSGTVTTGAISANAITAAAIAADAIGASELAADAAAEIGTAVWATAARTLTANTNLNDPTAATIADAVWDEARSGHTTAGSFGQYCLTDIRYVNGVQVTGDGSTTPWGPA